MVRRRVLLVRCGQDLKRVQNLELDGGGERPVVRLGQHGIFLAKRCC